MYGYVRIDKPELRVKDAHYYKNVYCSLCKEIGKNYGLASRFFLSYDLTFLAVVLNALENSQNTYQYRCPFNPTKKGKVYIEQNILQYAAYINYHMVLSKLKDNIEDDHSILARIIYWIMVHNPKYIKRKNLYSTQALDSILDQINHCENLEHSFDELTDLFGKYLVAMLEQYAQYYHKEYSQSLYEMLYLLGKWIYLIDAYDDYEKDQNEGSFNLINTMQSNEDVYGRVENMHYLLLDWMSECFEKIEWMNHDELIYNILFLNTQKTYELITKRKQESK